MQAGDVARGKVFQTLGEQFVTLAAIGPEPDHTGVMGNEVRAALFALDKRLVGAGDTLKPHRASG